MEVQMTPMIDVVFLLMVFFVWTAGFRIEQMLPSRISEQGRSQAAASQPPPPEADFHQVVIRVSWQDGRPAWLVNDEPFTSLEEVRGRLAALYDVLPEAPLVVDPDQATPLGHVIEVYDLTRLVGFQQVQFAVDEDV
jgi:biopolymer transport protein ExbD